jgi:hypothetical protein
VVREVLGSIEIFYPVGRDKFIIIHFSVSIILRQIHDYLISGHDMLRLFQKNYVLFLVCCICMNETYNYTSFLCFWKRNYLVNRKGCVRKNFLRRCKYNFIRGFSCLKRSVKSVSCFTAWLALIFWRKETTSIYGG